MTESGKNTLASLGAEASTTGLRNQAAEPMSENEHNAIRTPVFTSILGYVSDPDLAEKVHDLSHRGCVETITINQEDTARRRLRLETDKGTECAIALSRKGRLADGAILKLDDQGAIVVRLTAEQWLQIQPDSPETALKLGYFCGNLHWRVAFEGTLLKVALEGPIQDYLDRLEPFLIEKSVVVVDEA